MCRSRAFSDGMILHYCRSVNAVLHDVTCNSLSYYCQVKRLFRCCLIVLASPPPKNNNNNFKLDNNSPPLDHSSTIPIDSFSVMRLHSISSSFTS